MNDEMYKGVVYKYTCPENKIYIGTTINEIKRRKLFLSPSKIYAGPKINRARLKFEPKNFKYEIIFTISSYNLEEVLSILDKKEIEFINIFNSIINGYNLSEGGRKNHNLTLTEESKQKWLKKVQKKILQYNLEGEFIKEWNSIKEASSTLNISDGNICQVLKQQRYQCSNYIFRYKESENYPKQIEITPTKQQKKVVLKLDINGNIIKELPSINDAAREAGVNRTTMIKYLNGESNGYLKTPYRWRKKYGK